jgi:hypothetical protein
MRKFFLIMSIVLSALCAILAQQIVATAEAVDDPTKVTVKDPGTVIAVDADDVSRKCWSALEQAGFHRKAHGSRDARYVPVQDLNDLCGESVARMKTTGSSKKLETVDGGRELTVREGVVSKRCWKKLAAAGYVGRHDGVEAFYVTAGKLTDICGKTVTAKVAKTQDGPAAESRTAVDGSKVKPGFYDRTDYNRNGVADQDEGFPKNPRPEDVKAGRK